MGGWWGTHRDDVGVPAPLTSSALLLLPLPTSLSPALRTRIAAPRSFAGGRPAAGVPRSASPAGDAASAACATPCAALARPAATVRGGRAWGGRGGGGTDGHRHPGGVRGRGCRGSHAWLTAIPLAPAGLCTPPEPPHGATELDEMGTEALPRRTPAPAWLPTAKGKGGGANIVTPPHCPQ